MPNQDEVDLDFETGQVITAPLPTDTPDIEVLVVDPSPEAGGYRYEVVNIGRGDYMLVATRKGDSQVYGHKVDGRRGVLPVQDAPNHPGEWDALLIKNGRVVTSTQWVGDITLRNYLSSMGRIDIRFGPAQGPLNRLGQVRIHLWPRTVKPLIKDSDPDFAILVHFDSLPLGLPDGATYDLHISSPDGEEYTFCGVPIAVVGGFRARVAGNTQMVSGRWDVFVKIDGETVATNQFTIHESEAELPEDTRAPFEQFSVAI